MAHEILEQNIYTPNDPYPSVKGEQGYKKERTMMLMRGLKASNDLDVNEGSRVWANRNEGHPSYNHNLKHRALKPLNDRY